MDYKDQEDEIVPSNRHKNGAQKRRGKEAWLLLASAKNMRPLATLFKAKQTIGLFFISKCHHGHGLLRDRFESGRAKGRFNNHSKRF